MRHATRRQRGRAAPSLCRRRPGAVPRRGVSLSAGLPGWEALLHLTVEMWESRLGDRRPPRRRAFARLFSQVFAASIISGRYIRKPLGDGFQERVRAIIYSQPIQPPCCCRRSPAFCLPERGSGGIRAVVSYNYDDLLEVHLQRHGIRFRSIAGEGILPPKRVADLPRSRFTCRAMAASTTAANSSLPRMPTTPSSSIRGWATSLSSTSCASTPGCSLAPR